MSTATLITAIPAPEQIVRRIDACRDEIAALKILLRAAQAAERAKKAFAQRSEGVAQEVAHAAS